MLVKGGLVMSSASAVRCPYDLSRLLHSPVCSHLGFLWVLVSITKNGTTNLPPELCLVRLTWWFSAGSDFVP